MRIKFVPVIAFLLVVSITIVSCLGDNDPVEYSPDATIKAFALDSIYKNVYYKFTIDQVNGRIFNADSVPHSADTIINKILIKTITTNSGVITTGNGLNDTLFIQTDSVDFSTSMETPLKFKVYAPDGVTTKEYSISVLRHQQDPDSLIWSELVTNMPPSGFNASKTVIFDEKMYTYISNTSFYSSPVGDGRNWTFVSNVQNLPANIRLNTLIKHGDNLYILDADGQMYDSEDGVNWQPSAISGKVIALLSSLPNGLSAVVEENGTPKFAVSDMKLGVWDLGEDVPEDFPVDNISSTVYTTSTGIVRSVLVGTPADESATQLVPWFTEMEDRMNGKVWASMATNSDLYIPAMLKPTVMYYGDRLYVFGDGFKGFYVSDSGIVWEKIEKKMLFPEEFDERTSYSTVVDDDNFIWIIWNNQQQGSVRHGNEVWKGRLNKLGFRNQ